MEEMLKKQICSTCKSKECNKNIVVINEKDISIVKCLDYKKDAAKIKKYEKPLEITAHQEKALMRLNI